jgi:hypothetical protein
MSSTTSAQRPHHHSATAGFRHARERELSVGCRTSSPITAGRDRQGPVSQVRRKVDRELSSGAAPLQIIGRIAEPLLVPIRGHNRQVDLSLTKTGARCVFRRWHRKLSRQSQDKADGVTPVGFFSVVGDRAPPSLGHQRVSGHRCLLGIEPRSLMTSIDTARSHHCLTRYLSWQPEHVSLTAATCVPNARASAIFISDNFAASRSSASLCVQNRRNLFRWQALRPWVVAYSLGEIGG